MHDLNLILSIKYFFNNLKHLTISHSSVLLLLERRQRGQVVVHDLLDLRQGQAPLSVE